MVNSTAGASSDLIDPLVNYSSFSFNSSSIFRPLSNPNPDSLTSHLIQMAVKNPDLLVNQAKAIQERSKDPIESNKTAATTTSEDKVEVPITVNDNKPREKRVGLAHRKRTEFSMKPVSSQPEASLVPNLDIDKLADPVEFFAACERMENAEKELRRLRGEALEEIDINRVYVPLRRLEPSVLRRKTIYKHRSFGSVGSPSNNDALISSQEAHDPNIMSPPGEGAMPETNSGHRSPQTRVSVVKPAISKLSELDELLSCDYEGLDDVAVQNLLEEKLNIKGLDIAEPSLPDFFRRLDSGSNISFLPNMNDTIYHANDSSKPSTSQPLNFSHHFGKSSNNRVSPTLRKSPLASISTMNKHISRLTPLKDPFPFIPVDSDSSPEVLSYPKSQNSKRGDQIGKMIDSHEISRSSVNEEETNEAVISRPGSAGNIRIPNVESEVLFDGVASNDPLVTSKEQHELGRTSARGEDDTENLPSATTKDVAPSNDSEEWMNEIRQTEQTSTMENLFEIRTPINEEDNLEVLNEVSVPVAAKDVDATSVPMEEENQTAAVPEFVAKEVLSEGSTMEKAIVNGGDGEMEEPLNTQGTSIEKPNKLVTVNKGRKRKAKSKPVVTKEAKNKKKKAEDPLAVALPSNLDEDKRRHSLYAAGTKWEAGVRRSTRIRMRPLEFWRGERFLYGRVHESLVSVIGVKYASPAKDAQDRAVKVKSFVSDEYKNLLDLASSY